MVAGLRPGMQTAAIIIIIISLKSPQSAEVESGSRPVELKLSSGVTWEEEAVYT
jgi:hypothetical protein